MKLYQIIGGAACGCALLFLTGCSGGDRWTKNLPETVEASGVVLLDGDPVEGAQIVFAPKDGDYPASALTESDGSFQAKAFPSKDGVVPGTYQIGVAKTVEIQGSSQAAGKSEDAEHAAESESGTVGWENVLPRKYASPPSSGLEIEVPADGTSDLKIELSSR